MVDLPAASRGTARLSERKLRWFELALVMTLPFFAYFCHSFYQLAIGYSAPRSPLSPQMHSYEWCYSIVSQLGALALLYYILRRRQRSFFDLGLSFKCRDGLDTIGLLLLSRLLEYGLFVGWAAVYGALGGDGESLPIHNIEFMGAPVTLVAIAAMVINPIFEEMLVRAYFQTELTALTGSSIFALIVSVVFQASYHLYQGIPAALLLGVIFAVYGCYYRQTQRILPVILVHGFADLFALYYYAA